jgi:four helix bundle protein
MAVFKRFEEIKAWQKARELTKEIYKATCKDNFSKDFGLRDQIRRASVSIMANIAEGNGRKTNKDFASFLVISHGSAAEVQSHLYIALDLKYISQEEFSDLYEKLDEISKMTMALAQRLLST